MILCDVQESSSLSQLDTNTHTLNYIFGGIELEKVLLPLQFTFQEHFLQDEAALVHTKKVDNIIYDIKYMQENTLWWIWQIVANL